MAQNSLKKVNSLLKFILVCFWCTFFKILCKIFFDLKIEGKENIPENGPLIIVANHQNFADGVLITNLFPYSQRVKFIISKRVFSNPLCKHLAEITEAPISTNSIEESSGALLKLKSRIKENGIVGIFPEGDISSKSIPRKFKPGAAKLAIETKASILPIYINGTYELRKINNWFKKSKMILRIGKTIHSSEYSDLSVEDLTNLIRRQIIDLGNVNEIKVIDGSQHSLPEPTSTKSISY